MDCTHKFRDILRSGKALAELSDQICTEHNLSVITEPKSKDQSYDPELIAKGEITARDTLRMSIDAALRMRPDGFDALMQLLEDAGCWIKRGAQISIKPPGGKRFIRLDTVGTEYSEKVLRLTLAGKHIQSDKKSVCENWRYQLKIFKLKQSIKTKQENLRIYQKPGSVLHRIGLLIYAAPFSSHGPELQMIS